MLRTRPTRCYSRGEAAMPTTVVEDYLEQIYVMEQNGQRVIGARLAERIHTAVPTVTETIKRKTYPQDWPNYNRAQVNEHRHFQTLLADLCSTLPVPAITLPIRYVPLAAYWKARATPLPESGRTRGFRMPLRR